MSYRIAEDKRVSTPFMVNLDGFVLTHTYETVDIPSHEQADRFLPPYVTDNRFDFDNPKNMAFSAGPDTNFIFKFKEHEGVLAARDAVEETESAFAEIFGRNYSGLIENYRTDDADYVIVTLGSIAGLCRETADKLREKGVRAGVVRIRYMRPFPNGEIADVLRNVKAYAVLEKDISFGNEGTVFTNVNSALKKADVNVKGYNFIGGLGGKNISAGDIEYIFSAIADGTDSVNFIGIGGGING